MTITKNIVQKDLYMNNKYISLKSSIYNLKFSICDVYSNNFKYKHNHPSILQQIGQTCISLLCSSSSDFVEEYITLININ